MPKLFLFLISLVTILAAAYIIYVGNPQPQNIYKPGVWKEADMAVNQAKVLYQRARDKGEDLSAGPCLSNAVITGWVADIVHSPRLPIDNLPENQCSSFLEGGAKHFVELDTEGNVIRAQ